MPMRPPNQYFKVQANQPRFGMPMGEGIEPRKNRPIGDAFMNPIEEQGFGGINARPIPPIKGHFEPQVEEPWLGRRPARQQRQQQKFGHNATPPRHANQFGEPRGAQWVMMSIRMLGMIQEELEVILEGQVSGKGLITETPIDRSKMEHHGSNGEQQNQGQ